MPPYDAPLFLKQLEINQIVASFCQKISLPQMLRLKPILIQVEIHFARKQKLFKLNVTVR